jgi:Ser/Thr protein kinase RdoA (MazF antagonist)
MTSSILLTYFSADAIATLIEQHYLLQKVYCRLLTNSLRDVYLVESEGKRFVFYLYRHGWRTQAQIHAEWALMAHLGTSDSVLKVPQPMAVREGQKGWIVPMTAPEGERFGVLATYAEGASLRVRISADIVNRYGQALGKLHSAWSDDRVALVAESAAIRPSNDALVLLDNAYGHLRTALDHHPAMIEEISEAIGLIIPRVQALIPSPTTYGLIHGDVARHNALITEDGTLTLLDFDYCGVGWRPYDVATMFFSLHTQPPAKYAEYTAAFVEGYGQHHPLSPAETTLLPLFEAVRVLFDAGLMAHLAPIWGYQHCWNEVQGSLVQLRRVLALL